MQNQLMYILGELGNGGQERQLYNISLKLLESGYDPVIVVWNYLPDQKYAKLFKTAKIKTIELSPSDSMFKKYIQLRKIILNYKPVLLHSFSLYLNPAVSFACMGTGTVGIGGLRSGYRSGFKARNFLIRLASGFFPLNKISNNIKGANELKNIYRLFFMDTSKIQVFSNKIDLSSIKINRIAFNKFSEIRTVSMGSLNSVKQWDKLIQIIEILIKKSYNVKHLHAGTGKLEKELVLMVKEKSLEKYFTFAGEFLNLTEFYQNAYLLIHTARSEGSSNVIMEAVAHGVPVVTTNCGDVEYTIDHGMNGYIIDSGNQVEMADKIAYLLDNPEKLEKMSKYAVEKVRVKFDSKNTVDELMSIYNNLGINFN